MFVGGINLDQVRKIKRVGKDAVRVTYQNGDEETLDGVEAMSALREFNHSSADYCFVPAPHGYEIVNVTKENFSVYTEPVVAWGIHPEAAISRWSRVTVIGLSHNLEDGDDYWAALRYPDGRIAYEGEGDFESLESWIEHLRKQPREAAE